MSATWSKIYQSFFFILKVVLTNCQPTTVKVDAVGPVLIGQAKGTTIEILAVLTVTIVKMIGHNINIVVLT